MSKTPAEEKLFEQQQQQQQNVTKHCSSSADSCSAL